MSCAFLFVSAPALDATQLDALARAASRWLPFVPTSHTRHDAPTGGALHTWTALPQGARGAWHARDGDRSVCYSGWFVEDPGVSLDAPVASGLLDRLDLDSVGDFAQHTDGNFSVLAARLDDRPRAAACTDFIGAEHLYYGERAGVAVISNRSMLAACALHGGELPDPRPEYFRWMLNSIACPFGAETPWPDVSILDLYSVVRCEAGRVRLEPRPEATDGADASWDELFDDLCARVSQFTRLPDLPFQAALTGGKDSRLILAALVASGAASSLERLYIAAPEGHPDARVARDLADHYGLPFERVTRAHDDLDWRARIQRHNVLSEFGLHPWDLKVRQDVPAQGAVHGNVGEIYRSHFLPRHMLGWWSVRAKYTSTRYIDQNGLLTAPMIEASRRELAAWVARARDERTPLRAVHDRYHREVRMHRWVGHAQIVDAAASVASNPIPSRGLLTRYLALPLADQRRERVHFELTRRADDWLWRQPFANATWHERLAPDAHAPPVRGDVLSVSRQMTLWRAHGAELAAWVCSPGAPRFFHVVAHDKLRALASRLTSHDGDPTQVELKAMLGAAGLRLALESSPSPAPFTLAENAS
jgi:hypothetical protein